MTPLEIFKDFCAARVRQYSKGHEELIHERVTLKDLFKGYNRWKLLEKKGRIPLDTFTTLCEEAFGDSRGQHLYAHIRVFFDEDDVEEFDADHKRTLSNPIVNPTTDAVPSERMANYILNSENKMELIRGLIEDKRALSFEIDELEKKIESLEKYERHTNAFIYNLIKKQGDAYLKATAPQ